MADNALAPKFDVSEIGNSYILALDRLTSDDYIRMAVGRSIDTLLGKDAALLANGVGERCICHKLAELLAVHFP